MEEIDRIQTNSDVPPSGSPDAAESEEDPAAARLAPAETRVLGELGINAAQVDRVQEILADNAGGQAQSRRERRAARREERRAIREQRSLAPAQIATRGILAELRRDSRKALRRAKSRPARAT